MNFFELFRILFATHFVLGIKFALWFWVYIPSALGVFSTADATVFESLLPLWITVLSVLWYYVWYGSIVFALYGKSPILSIRAFSVVLAFVYVSFGLIPSLLSSSAALALMMQHELYFAVIAAMLFLSLCGITILPGLKRAADLENERLALARDARLDEAYRWGSVTIPSEERNES